MAPSTTLGELLRRPLPSFGFLRITLITAVLDLRVALGLAVLALSGCGGDQLDPTSAATIASEAATPLPAFDPDDGDLTRIGDVARSGAITLRVLRVTTTTVISGEKRTVRAAPGERFVLVTTRVKNGTSQPIDFICGPRTDARVFGAAAKSFKAIDELAAIVSNQACGQPVRPGSSTTQLPIARQAGALTLKTVARARLTHPGQCEAANSH